MEKPKDLSSLLPPGAGTSSPEKKSSAESLLPPGAGGSVKAEKKSKAESLLPPGVGKQEEKPAATPPPDSKTADGVVRIPTEEGGFVALREKPKTVVSHGEEIELRRLTPEEKLFRRRVKNAIVWTFCGSILVATLFYLLYVRG